MTVAVEAGATGEAGVPSGGPGPAIWLGGRFRLDERIPAAGALSLWKATDGLLCRPVTIHLLPHWVEAIGWRYAFAPLAIGPAIGVWAMARLRADPRSAQLAGGRR